MPTRSELCIRCGECCKFFILEIRKPELPQEQREWAAWMRDRGIIVVRDHGRYWRLKIPYHCPHLRIVEKDALIVVPGHEKDHFHYCDIYPTRNDICRRFDGRLEDRRDGLKCLWLTEKFEG